MDSREMNQLEVSPSPLVESDNIDEDRPVTSNIIEKAEWRHIKLQIYSSIVISFAMMHTGMTISFPNLLKSSMDYEMISNFASIGALATPLGSFLTSSLTDRMGRKKTLIILEMVSVVTWFMVACSDKDIPILFYTSGIFSGLTRGALTSHCPAFISEITHNLYRQMFLSFITFFFTIGYCITSVLNVWLTWKHAAWCYGSIFIGLAICTLSFVPESPHWLAVIRMDLERAKRSLRKYNRGEEAFRKEWTVIQTKIETAHQNYAKKTQLSSLITRPEVYKPSVILLFLLFFQQACCIYPVSAYTLLILPTISVSLGGRLKKEIFILIAGIRLIISISTTIFLKRFNQKQLLNTSFIGMVVFSLPLIGFQLMEKSSSVSDDEIHWKDWIAVSSFLLYTAFGCIGAVGIPWTIIFELLPTEARGVLGPVFVAYGYVIMSAFLKFFLDVLNSIGTAYTFVIIGLISLAGSVFIQLFVPETRGKSLSDIENRFSMRKK